ncbi:sugar transferase [Georgenia halophila]|uniref:Sugar transferase n=1 Tax=Georgenia halophila TaxID=620889 RepID=A0ABP8KTA2_9MICO
MWLWLWPARAPEPARRWDRHYRAGVALTDLMVLIVAVTVADLARFGAEQASLTLDGGRSVRYEVVGVILALVWFCALGAWDTRVRRVIGAGMEEYRRVLAATLAAFGLIAILSYLAPVELSRSYVLVALPVGMLLLLGGRLAWRLGLTRVRNQGRALTGTVVVGSADEVNTAVAEMRRYPEAGYAPVAVALTTPEDAGAGGVPPVPELPRISLEELRLAAQDPRLGAVMIAGGMPSSQIKQIAWDLETGESELLLVSQLTDVAGPRIHQSPVTGLPVVHVDLPSFSGGVHVLKRTMDVVIASAALVLLAPLFAAVALAIKLDDGGPVFFRQERVGQDGSTFRMHKFRSMAVDAESRRAALQAEGPDNGVLFKMANDPRVTKVGRFIRRHSLDEFPQFWDVLRGKMSVVGPRPPLPAEVEQYEAHVYRRLLIKPGVTGLWQVSGRSDLSWDDSVRLDLSYVENWSVSGDLLLILKTFRTVVSPSGAY